MKKYSEENAEVFKKWKEIYNFDWMKPIDHETFLKAKNKEPLLTLTPIKKVPFEWYKNCKGKKILGLAAGGGQQMAVLSALGAKCTLLDISTLQLEADSQVSEREKYYLDIIKGDMSEILPFEDNSFDMVVNPISNHYIENPFFVFKEVYRVLKKGGSFLAGLDNGLYWSVNPNTMKVEIKQPVNPLKNKVLMENILKKGQAIQFSHSIEEQIRGQLKAGFKLIDMYDDTEPGVFQMLNVNTCFATYSVK